MPESIMKIFMQIYVPTNSLWFIYSWPPNSPALRSAVARRTVGGGGLPRSTLRDRPVAALAAAAPGVIDEMHLLR
jgi:hypothetical protein